MIPKRQKARMAATIMARINVVLNCWLWSPLLFIAMLDAKRKSGRNRVAAD
jgi:hypothetical protein